MLPPKALEENPLLCLFHLPELHSLHFLALWLTSDKNISQSLQYVEYLAQRLTTNDNTDYSVLFLLSPKSEPANDTPLYP